MGLFQPTEYVPRSFHKGALARATAVSMVAAKNSPAGRPAAACSEWYGQVPDTADPAYPGYARLSSRRAATSPASSRRRTASPTSSARATTARAEDRHRRRVPLADAAHRRADLRRATTIPTTRCDASQLVTLWGPGQTQTPDTGWYGEQTLDVEAAHAMAPGATIVAVAAQSAYDQDLIGAINLVVERAPRRR